MSQNQQEKNHDIYVAETLGSIKSSLVSISERQNRMETAIAERQDRMEKKLDGVVNMTNRWKGATAILIVIGGLLGSLGTYLMKFAGKA